MSWSWMRASPALQSCCSPCAITIWSTKNERRPAGGDVLVSPVWKWPQSQPLFSEPVNQSLLCALSSSAAGRAWAAGSTLLTGGAEPGEAAGAEPEPSVLLSAPHWCGTRLARQQGSVVSLQQSGFSSCVFLSLRWRTAQPHYQPVMFERECCEIFQAHVWLVCDHVFPMIPCCRMSKDGSLVVWVNMEDHLRLVSTRDDSNIAEAFKCICINLQKVSDN